MDKAQALAILHEINHAQASASHALEQTRVLSGRQQAIQAEREWVSTIKEGADA